MEVVASGATKSTGSDVDKICQLLGPDARVITDGSPAELLRLAGETGADILIARSRNQYTALKGKLPFLDINQERHTPYAGYAGVVELARRVDRALSSPVWEQVRSPAPWELRSPAVGELGAPGARGEARLMARVVASGRRAAIDPLKHSQPLGGALVFLGLARAMPVLHGSQGCASFAKALMTRHFGEPVPLQTTAVTEVTAVIGAGESLVAALDAIRARQHPDIIGVLTTGLTEVSGEDVAGELRSYLAGAGAGAPLIVAVSAPDFRGGLSDGWASALEAVVTVVPLDAAPARDPGEQAEPPGPEPLAVLAGPSLTAVDIDEFAALVRGFGLDPVVVPDLSGSLDGHLDGWSPLTTGGTTIAGLRRLGAAGAIVVAGATARRGRGARRANRR